MNRDLRLDDRLPLELDEREIARLAGLPPGVALDPRTARLVDEARAWLARDGGAWMRLRFEPDAGLGEGAPGVAVIAASAGEALDARVDADWRGGRPDRAFALDRVGAALVEHLVRRATDELAEVLRPYGLAPGVRSSPGCEGRPLAQQAELLAFLTEPGEPPLPGPLELFESGALRPRLSQLALVPAVPVDGRSGIARSHATPSCVRCTYAPCAFRRPASVAT